MSRKMKSKGPVMAAMSCKASPTRDLYLPGDPGPGEVAPGPLGHGFIQFQADDPAPGGLTAPGQVDGGIAGGGAQFQDIFGAGGPGQDKEQFPHHRADDGDAFGLGLLFQVQEHLVPHGDKAPEISLQIGGHLAHLASSGFGVTAKIVEKKNRFG